MLTMSHQEIERTSTHVSSSAWKYIVRLALMMYEKKLLMSFAILNFHFHLFTWIVWWCKHILLTKIKVYKWKSVIGMNYRKNKDTRLWWYCTSPHFWVTLIIFYNLQIFQFFLGWQCAYRKGVSNLTPISTLALQLLTKHI